MAQPRSPTPELPPSLLLYQMGVGHYVSRALDLAARLNLADQLRDGPRAASEVARATGTHAPSLRRVMRLLASVGVFEERDDGSFALTPVGELLRTDHPESMWSAGAPVRGCGRPGPLAGAGVLRAHRTAGLSQGEPGRRRLPLHGGRPGAGRGLRRGHGDLHPPDLGRGGRDVRLLPLRDDRGRGGRQRGAAVRDPEGVPEAEGHRVRPPLGGCGRGRRDRAAGALRSLCVRGRRLLRVGAGRTMPICSST
jgi:hypothetical protein